MKFKKKQPNVCRATPEIDSIKENKIFQSLMKESGIKPWKTPESEPETEAHEFKNKPESDLKTEAHEFKNNPEILIIENTPATNEKFAGQKIKTLATKRKKIQIKIGFQPDAQLDLHGETRDSLQQILVSFLKNAHCHGYESLLIITGKGLNSPEPGGVLRKITQQWLQEIEGTQIKSYKTAPAFLGGNGAFLVFL